MNDVHAMNLTAARHGWRRDTGDRKSGRRRALFAPFTHQRPDKLPRVRKPPALPCPFAGQSNRTCAGHSSYVKQKRPDRKVEASRQGFEATMPTRQSTRDHCQFSPLNQRSSNRDVSGGNPVLPSRKPSRPCWHPSCRKPCSNWSCLLCWMILPHHPGAERRREEDHWDDQQAVATLSALCQRRRPEPLLRRPNRWPCSEPPSFGPSDWRSCLHFSERSFEVPPARLSRRTDCPTPRRCRGRRMTVLFWRTGRCLAGQTVRRSLLDLFACC
jgi:hypothetical protein